MKFLVFLSLSIFIFSQSAFALRSVVSKSNARIAKQKKLKSGSQNRQGRALVNKAEPIDSTEGRALVNKSKIGTNNNVRFVRGTGLAPPASEPAVVESGSVSVQ